MNNSSNTTLYTCPMHPKIIRNNPGDCPICGMSLEPTLDSKSDDNGELLYLKKRFWVSLLLSIPVFVSAMINDLNLANISFISPQKQQWFQFLLSTPIVFWCGLIFFKRAWRSIISRSLNMFTLIALGISTAWGYSVIALLFPHFFPPEAHNQEGLIPVYFETASVITALILLGQFLELKAKKKTSSAIKLLMELAPKTARIIKKTGDEEDVHIEKIQEKDHLRVRPGEKIPVDGTILEGSGHINESMITGEPFANLKQAGDEVIGSTLNEDGSFIIEAKRVGNKTLLSEIISMVSDAQRSRAPIQKLVDVVSKYFVPTVILTAIITFCIWYFIGNSGSIEFAIVNAIAVLIISCPCALGLATPISIMVGTGKGATAGILFKDAEALETFKKIDTLVVDKTGTITEGKPQLVKVIVANFFNEDDVLKLCASLENLSEHPLGQAITNAAKSKKISLLPVSDFTSITGKGISGRINHKNIKIGSYEFVKTSSIDHSNLKEQSSPLLLEGNILIYVSIDDKISAVLCIADPIKPTSFSAITKLKEENINIVLLTGDNIQTAKAIGKQLSIDNVVADVLPKDKAEYIQKLQSQGHIVAMAGDGINDAPALASADIGIAMGTGADIAIESAKITLVKGDLDKILKAKKLSKATINNIRQNLFFAFFYNIISIPIAAGILYPSYHILLSPMFAAIAMSLSSISVILNALRLKILTL